MPIRTNHLPHRISLVSRFFFLVFCVNCITDLQLCVVVEDPPEVRERSRSFLDKLKTAATGGKQKTKPQRPPRPSKDKKKSDSSSAQSSASSSVEQPKKRRTVWESIRKKIGLAGGSHSGSGSSSGSHSSEALRRTITGTSLSSGAETKPPSNTVVGLPIKR